MKNDEISLVVHTLKVQKLTKFLIDQKYTQRATTNTRAVWFVTKKVWVPEVEAYALQLDRDAVMEVV